MVLHKVSCVSDIEPANENDGILHASPSLYELLASMEDIWTLALKDTLSVGSNSACPNTTIAESTNYVESEDCYIKPIIPGLYNAPTSMEFQLLMDSKSPSSGHHSSLVDLIGSPTLTVLLLHFVQMGRDNPSKSLL